MPELPEVQATVDYLRERVEGAVIVRGSVSWGRSVSPKDPRSFEKEIIGCTIVSVYRRGKYVGMELSGERPLFLLTHLRMSGSLDVIPSGFPLSKHDRVSLDLDSGKSIRFNDTRKFGRMVLCECPQNIIGHLGVEPLDPSCTPAFLSQILRARKRVIKSALLDQTIIAGLGNIYVDEVLWKTKIHPLRSTDTLSDNEILSLHAAIQETLHEAISKLGTDFGDGVVDGGMYSPRVYGREGKTCLRCKDTIKRLVVGQRGTHICPSCQRPRRARPKSFASRTRLQKRQHK